MTPTLPLLHDAEIVVVGGGPAGSIAAFTLASAGHDVVIVDKQTFPRDKACGDGLTSSAASFLGEIGLGEVLADAHPVEAVRVFVDWRERDVSPMRTKRPSPGSQPCCMPRTRLDDALLQRACSAGARLVHGHVTAPIVVDGEVVGVELTHDGAAAAISARHVLAADGATSRLYRRLAGPSEHRRQLAYALRQYVRTDGSFSQAFEIYAPLPEEVTSYGYGWVFPVAEHLANIGVGYLSGRGVPRPPSLNGLLDSFLAGLRKHRRDQLGELETVGRALGGPFGGSFSASRCQLGGVIFLGDAAQTTDPITGEGIGQAMRSARAAALALHEATRRRARPVGIGHTIARSNLRLGQDTDMTARWTHQLLKGRYGQGARDSERLTSSPTFSSAYNMLIAESEFPTLAQTAAGRFARRLGFADFMSALDVSLRDTVRTDFVLGSELLYREVCGGIGSAGALVVAASQASCASETRNSSEDAALCVELSGIYPRMLTGVTAIAGEQAKANNALALMIADCGLSRAISAAARLGPEPTLWLGDAIVANCEGLARVVQSGFDPGRSIRDYLDSARLTRGASYSLAARLGARVAGADPALMDALGAAGESFGIAAEIYGDILALTREDPVTGRRPRQVLQEGSMSLPILYALREDPDLARLLSIGRESDEWDAVLECLAQSPGLGRAASTSERHAERARAQVANALGRGSPLAALFEFASVSLVEPAPLPLSDAEVLPGTSRAGLRLAS